MICDNLTTLLGFECCPLTAAGDVALISTPFQFEDGEGFPAFAEVAGNQLRFFDDGGTLLHFLGRGLRLDTWRRMRFITSAAEQHGATFTDCGEIEVWAPLDQAADAFGKYVSTMMAIAAWEKEQRGVAVDTGMLLDEVVLALRAWKPDAELQLDPPPLQGISGQAHKIDLVFDGKGVVATSSHPNAVSANLKKLVDIKALLANQDARFLVIIDDRADPVAADREARVMQTVATVMPYTALTRSRSGTSSALH